MRGDKARRALCEAAAPFAARYCGRKRVTQGTRVERLRGCAEYLQRNTVGTIGRLPIGVTTFGVAWRFGITEGDVNRLLTRQRMRHD